MAANQKIYYLNNSNINKEKWDECIKAASNGLIYGYTYYLDVFCKWDALVLNDYEAVMPLPFKKKYGINYIYQPFLTAQLGLFGNKLSAELLNDFLHSIPKKFRYWHFSLNYNNLFPSEHFRLYRRVNYVLDLNKPYEEIFKNYRENVKRNIKKAIQYKCSVIKDVDVKDIIELAKLQNNNQSNEDDYKNFEKLYHQLKQNNNAAAYGVISAAGELLASSVFFFSPNRAYYILVGNHPNGRTLGASHLLIDAFIKDHAGNNLVLDFEGSDIRNLQFFYSSFGAIEEPYAAIQYNKLPWYIKWLKK